MTNVVPTDLQKPLCFFFQCSDDVLNKEGVASALQSFETAIMLIAYERWPSIVPLIWGACEALLRVKYPNSDEKIHIIQEKFKLEKNISSALNNNAHKLRQLRNDIAHKGYIPRDTQKCIELFFNAGIPYLDCLLEDVTGLKLFEALYPQSEGEIWSVFKDTRKVITRKINKSDDKIEKGLLFLILKIRNKFSPTYISEALWDMQSFYEEELWISEMRFKNKLINCIEKKQNDYCFELSDIRCPICGSDVLACFLWKGKGENWQFDSLNSVGCYKCVYLIEDKDLIEIFFHNRLTKELISELESDNPPLAKTVCV
jgi:hypothetical protein